MKNTPFVALLVFAVLIFTGCTSLAQRIDKALPEGSAKHVSATITGKFSSTTVTAENFVKDETKVTAEKMHFRHSNAWVPLIEGEVVGYERLRKPSQK